MDPNRRSLHARSRACAGLAFLVSLLAVFAAPPAALGQSSTPIPAPTSATPAPSSPAPPAPAGSGSAPAAAPVEVTVHGQRLSGVAGGDQVTPSDARAIPGTFGDPFQALA